MKNYIAFIREAKSKAVVLPHGMGTIMVEKRTEPNGETTWSFEYKGVRGTIKKGYSRMGGMGYSVVEIIDTDGHRETNFHGTHKTIGDAVVSGTSHMRWAREKAKKGGAA